MDLNLGNTEFTKVSSINIPDIFYKRLKTGIVEFDSMFGEGLLPGSSITVTARAGCGKTTFLLQLIEALSRNQYTVGFASGEESTLQLAFNCERLGVENVLIANETDIDKLVEATVKFDVLVIDSFQALTSKDKMNARKFEQHAVTTLVNAAKQNECVIFFIMHLTKGGVLKGGTIIPHTVDVNMSIDLDRDAQDESARVISFQKNRFGQCKEFNCILTSTGFEFISERNVVSVENKKKTKLEENIDKVILMKEPPYITKSRVMSELGLTGSQAYILLKEMMDHNIIQKFGRGGAAVYKVVKMEKDEPKEI